MFYCNPCAADRKWPRTPYSMSYGRCEICYDQGRCNDTPTKDLPVHPDWLQYDAEQEAIADIKKTITKAREAT